MLVLTLLAAAVASPPANWTRASATATVRILAGTVIRNGPAQSSQLPMVRTTVRAPDGTRLPALLVEFQ